MKVQFIITLLALFVLGSSAYASPHKNLTLEDLQQVEYKIEGISEDDGLQSIYLTEYKKAVPNDASTEKLYLCSYAFGDLNGDGLGDAVAVVALNTGGSGNFTYLTALLNDHGSAHCIDQLSLGDRSICNSLKIKNRMTTCDMETHASGDSASFPSVHRILKYKLVNNKLMGPHDVQ